VKVESEAAANGSIRWPAGQAALGGILALHTLIHGLFDLC